MSDQDLGTWLSAISLGHPEDIPQYQLALLVQVGYCNWQFKMDLHRIPVELYHCCHSNIDRPIDAFARLLREPPPAD